MKIDRHARGDPGDGSRPLSPSDAWVWFSLLGICGAQYIGILSGNQEARFYTSSVLLMAGLAVMLVAMVRQVDQK